jgi:hypothetical protein
LGCQEFNDNRYAIFRFFFLGAGGAEEIAARLLGLFPNAGLYEYDKQENAISSLYSRLQESKTAPDVSEMLQALYEVVDTAVATEHPGISERRRYDLTKVDIRRLQAEFERQCPNIKMLNLREKIEKRLAKMIALNPTRVDLYERYQEIVKHLFINLPGEGYTEQEIAEKADIVFAHLYDTGLGMGGSQAYH